MSLIRELLKYTVGCALRPTQAVVITWKDTCNNQNVDIWNGSLSLAPEWINNNLSMEEHGWLHACLASRVNYYGIRVELSMRGPNPLLDSVGVVEASTFTTVEGAFWSETVNGTNGLEAFLYSCYQDKANDDRSLARSVHRDCAAGHLVSNTSTAVVPCGPIQLVGPCSRACQNWNNVSYWNQCRYNEDAPWAQQVITISLDVPSTSS